MWFFVSLYLQQVLGYSPIRAGLAFLPMTLCIVAGSTVASRLVQRIGAKPTPRHRHDPAGRSGWSCFAVVQANGTYLADVLVPSLLVALGIGLSFVPATIAAVAGVAPQEAGLASGLVNTSRLFGGALGLAVLAAIATARTNSDLHAGTTPRTRADRAASRSPSWSPPRSPLVGALVALFGLPRVIRAPPARRPRELEPKPPAVTAGAGRRTATKLGPDGALLRHPRAARHRSATGCATRTR